MCKTNPISGGPAEEIGQGRPTHSLSLRAGSTKNRPRAPLPPPAHKQSQSASAIAPNKANRRRPVVQTKPICRTTSTKGSDRQGFGKTKPISRRTERDESRQNCRFRRSRQLCETKPIRQSRSPEGTGGQGRTCGRRRGQACGTKPMSGDARWDGAAGTRDAGQSCETKPIPPERHEAQVFWGRRLMVNFSCTRPRQNKANFSALRRQARTRQAAAAPLPGAVVRNEANLGAAPGPAKYSAARRRDTISAKRSQFAQECQVRSGKRRVCGTKPISVTVPTEAPEDLPSRGWAGRLSGEGKGYAEPHKTRWRKE
jgi:hypothetical protein